MVIYSPNGTPVIRVVVNDSSYLYEEIMGDANIVLEFSLTEHIELEPGSYVLFRGTKYELYNRTDVSIQHSRNYEYKATFSGPQARFSRYVVYNSIDGRVRFDMLGTPKDHLDLIIGNLNLREAGMWSYGSYITDKPETLVSYNHTSIKDALNAIAEAFDTEWSVEPNGNGYVINLRKNEFHKDSPLALGYGKNRGFKPGVGRVNYGDFGQVEKVWIDGGERNLSIGEYGWTTLHFPAGLSLSADKNGKLRYTVDGRTYTENGFDSSSAIAFVTDEWGSSVRIASASPSCNEVSLDLTQFYPKREGTATGVRYVYKGQYLTYEELVAAFPNLTDEDWLEIQVDIIDETIPQDLDYAACCFSADDPLTVIFQSGQLTGREFSAAFRKEAKTREEDGQTVIVRPANRFELVRTTIDGVDMPNDIFRPNTTANDKYIVVNVYMPEQYIRDFAHFEGAEIEALRAACKFIHENKDPQFTFKGVVDDLYSKRNWLNVGGRLALGECISFQDDNIQPAPVVTRIIGLKTYINSPYAPELTLSNETVRGGMASTIAQLRAADEHVVERVKEARRFTQRSFRDAKETISMLAGALDYFSDGINPITVETMSLLVGDQSLQFKFWTNRSCTTPVVNPVVYDPDTHKVSIPACVVQHMTLGIADVRPSDSRSVDEYLRWSMEAYESPALTGTDEQGKDLSETAFYVYAKVDAANVAKPDAERTEEELAHIGGVFVVSKTKLPFEPTAGDNNYHLLVGILNSEYEGGRSFAPMYGFTEVLPGQITTDVIRSSNGQSFFDLANNQFSLGQTLSFINNVLTLRGSLVVTGAGDAVPMGAWCGQWQNNRRYALGDEVWAEINGAVSTFRYVYSTPSDQVDPPYPFVTNEQYWLPIATGQNGTPGAFKSTVFMRTNDNMATAANTPTGGNYASPFPDSTHTDSSTGGVLSWTDGIPPGDAKLWATTCTFQYDGTSTGWSTPRQMTDTETFDVEFAKKQTNDADPPTPTDANRHGGSGTQVWFDPDLDSTQDFKQMYWRAERENKNGVWGSWTITRIKGEKGDASPGLSIDISNEVDGLAVGSDEKLSVATNLETSVSAFLGTDATSFSGIRAEVPAAFASKIDVKRVSGGTSTSIVSGSYITVNAQVIELVIAVAANTDFSGVQNVPISIFCSCGILGSRELTFKIIPVKDGEDGEVYKLMPDFNVVKGVPGSGSAVTYTPTHVKCSRMRGKGDSFGPAESVGYLRYSVDGGSTIKTDYNSSTGVAVSSAATAGKIIFYWYLNSDNTGLLDQETVPIVVDGANGSPGSPGSPGLAGYNQATIMLYRRSSTPITAISWSNDLTFTFSTNALSSIPTNWSRNIPTGTDPVYVTAASVASRDDSVTITANQWATPVMMVQNGENGVGLETQWSTNGTSWHSTYETGDIYMRQRMTNGTWSEAIRVVGENGDDVYVSFVFKGSNTQPSTPTGTNPVPSGWDDAPPQGSETAVSAQYDSNFTGTPKHIVTVAENGSAWGKITFTAQAGEKIAVKVRASSEPSYDYGYVSPLDDESHSTVNYAARVSGLQSTTVTFTIQTSGTHFVCIGYKKDGSRDENDDTVYVDGVVKVESAPIWFSKSLVTNGVSDGNWSEPARLTGEDGADGANGTNGTNGINATVVILYQRGNATLGTGVAPSKPSSSLTYTFATGELTGTLGGWSTAIPGSNGYPCYVTQATAISADATDTILSSEWSTPVALVSDGQPGAGITSVRIFYGVSSTSDMPVTWVEDDGTGSNVPSVGPGVWLWVKEVTAYSDGTTKTTYTKSLSGGTGPASVFRGTYSSSTSYYGSLERTDIVRGTDGLYYRANPLASPNPFTNKNTSNRAYWLPFQGQYENLATGFAFIEELVVMKLNTAGDTGSADARIVAQGNYLKMYDEDNIERLLITGDDISLDSNVTAYPTLGNSIDKTYSGQDDSGTDSGRLTICSFTISSGTKTVSIPQIVLDLSEASRYDGDITGCNISVLLTRSGTTIATLGTYSTDNLGGTISFSASQRSLSAGNYNIVVNASWSWSVEVFSTGEDITNIRIADVTNGNVLVYSGTDNKVSIGANGLVINLGNNFSAVFGLNNGSPIIRLEGLKSNGNQVGLKIDTDGIKVNRGSGYQDL